MILGTISYVDDEAGLQLIIDGEDEPTTKKYSYISSYVPEADDRVIIEEIGGSYVIMGKLITEFENSGLARKADHATNATNATNAENAQNATHASSATVSSSCTGNAATATTAVNAQNLVGASTTSGYLVNSVSTAYNQTIGNYVTGVSISGPYAILRK